MASHTTQTLKHKEISNFTQSQIPYLRNMSIYVLCPPPFPYPRHPKQKNRESRPRAQKKKGRIDQNPSISPTSKAGFPCLEGIATSYAYHPAYVMYLATPAFYHTGGQLHKVRLFLSSGTWTRCSDSVLYSVHVLDMLPVLI